MHAMAIVHDAIKGWEETDANCHLSDKMVPPHPEQEALALAHIQAHPGITLSELLATYPYLAIDVMWT